MNFATVRDRAKQQKARGTQRRGAQAVAVLLLRISDDRNLLIFANAARAKCFSAPGLICALLDARKNEVLPELDFCGAPPYHPN